MSIHYINDVLDSPEPRGLNRLVLLALAEAANEAGVCWPGMDYVARRAASSARSVRRAVRELEAAGLIAVNRNAGPGMTPDKHTNMFRLTWVRGAMAETAGGQGVRSRDDDTSGRGGTTCPGRGDDMSGRGGTNTTERGDDTSSKPSENRHIEPSGGDEPQTPSEAAAPALQKTPTLAEWIAYAGSIGYIDEADAAQAWHNYESAKTAQGWWLQRGGKKITNWRSACVTCRGNWQRFRRGGSPARTTVRVGEKIGDAGAAGGQPAFDPTDILAEPVGAGEAWGLGFAQAAGGGA